jgi:hypothetical protein
MASKLALYHIPSAKYLALKIWPSNKAISCNSGGTNTQGSTFWSDDFVFLPVVSDGVADSGEKDVDVSVGFVGFVVVG